MRGVLAIVLVGLLFFSGCAPKGYTTAEINSVMRIYEGEVLSARAMIVEDSGEGTILGAILGAIIGHQFGGGSGKDVATAAGAILGGVIGNNLNKANAQELVIRLDRGEEISTLVKVDRQRGFWFRPGDRVRIFVRDGRIVKVEPSFK